MIQKKIIHLSLFFTLNICSLLFFTPFSQSQNVSIQVGNGSGEPGSKNNQVILSLVNSFRVKGIQLVIKDEKNYLSASGCEAIGRASSLTCDVNEKKYGWAILQLYSFGGAMIEIGSEPILKINYDVKQSAPPGECFPLRVLKKARAIESQVSDEKKNEIKVPQTSGSFCITGESEEEDETTTTSSTSDSADTATEESATDISSNQLASDANRINLSGGSSQLTYGSPRTATPATSTAPDTAARQVSTRRTTASTRESTPNNPSGTSKEVSDPGSSRSRIVVSPESVTLTSGDLIALTPQTINDGTKVEGDYSYKITPPSPIRSTIDDNGLFTAGINTSSSNIEETIEITDIANKNATAIVTITITGRKQPSSGCELFISPSFATISPENSIAFTAHNFGNDCQEGLYKWKVNSKIGSSINAQGFYKAGRNKSIDPALDIIMVSDSINEISSDIIITVLSGPKTAPGVSSASLNPLSLEADEKKIYPKILVFLTILTFVIGIIIIRKFKH